MNGVQEELMVRVAWMYYEDGLTQQDIADQLNLCFVVTTQDSTQGRL